MTQSFDFRSGHEKTLYMLYSAREKDEILRKHILQGGNSSIGFIEAVHQWINLCFVNVQFRKLQNNLAYKILQSFYVVFLLYPVRMYKIK